MKKSILVTFFAIAIFAVAGIQNSVLAQKSKKGSTMKHYSWRGSIDKSTPIFVWFEENEDGILAGEIVYTYSTSKTPIRLLGRVIKYPHSDAVMYSLVEFWGKNGQQTGYMSFEIDTLGKGKGTWNNVEKDFSLDLDTIVPFPAGKGGFLRPITQKEFGTQAHNYRYYYIHPQKSQLGGTVELQQIEHKYIRFDISVNDPNIAEGNNFADYTRTFMLGNKFSYIISQCNYAFEASIFNDFLVITSKTTEPSDCFGMGSSFEGFYLEQGK